MILLANWIVCCSQMVKRGWRSNDLRVDFSQSLQPVSVLEADRVEPAHYGKCGDGLDEGVVEGEQDVFSD